MTHARVLLGIFSRQYIKHLANIFLIFSASHDQTAMIWQWNIEKNTAECKQICRGHERGLDCVGVSPNKERMATGSWDTMLKLWSACKLH